MTFAGKRLPGVKVCLLLVAGVSEQRTLVKFFLMKVPATRYLTGFWRPVFDRLFKIWEKKASRSGLGFYQITAFALGPRAWEIVCDPLKVESLFPPVLWDSCC